MRKAYAVAGATSGTGYDILLNWSAKSSKHDAGETEALSAVRPALHSLDLRAYCRVRTTTLYERLAAMTAAGIVVKSPDGYCLAAR